MKINKHVLKNGLTLLHIERNTPLVCVNLLYKVGSKYEDPEKTGFAHLFEHLMFEGTKDVKHFDTLLQQAGGDNNAFTSPDITNYYENLPIDNLELALFLEADRMANLDISQEKLDIQKGVVIEEFKQRYLNQPYGDVWLKARPLLFQKHGYHWPTIGKTIQHIEDATLADVIAFHDRYYTPKNAILSVVGGIAFEDLIPLVEKHFSNIQSHSEDLSYQPALETQREEKTLTLTEGNIPNDSYYYVVRVPGIQDTMSYRANNLLAEYLGKPGSGKLFEEIVLKQKVATSLQAGCIPGDEYCLFLINAMPAKGVTPETLKEHIQEALKELNKASVSEEDTERLKEPYKTRKVFGEMTNFNVAYSIAHHEANGGAENYLKELEQIDAVKPTDLQYSMNELLAEQRLNIYYHA